MRRQHSKGQQSKNYMDQKSRSFSRYESPPASPTKPIRSNTIEETTQDAHQEGPDNVKSDTRDDPVIQLNNDVFETPDGNDEEAGPDSDVAVSFSQGYDELPVEIQSLMERFLESLALRSHPAPLSMERLSELYQDFYEHAHAHIHTHISALSTRISRDQSPSPSVSSGRSAQGRNPSRKNSRPLERAHTLETPSSDTPMLTVSEISDKRKARRQLEMRRIAMEEAVERGVCEKVYPRIWRHASTDDEARDEKLRSRAAALSVVGVDLKELISTALSESITLSTDLNSSDSSDDTSPRALLGNARKSLEDMNAERYPLGKLSHLFAVHKHIVEALQQIFLSTSSADEVLPTLIYTIITSPPQSNNLISNFNFIQRFRKSSKIDGEAAYCLTNLEAAITFLETVDLSSIRPEEGREGPAKISSGQSTPRSETQDPMYRGLPGDISGPAKSSSSIVKTAAAQPSRSRSRSLSNAIVSKPRPLEAASDAVMQSADAAFDNIHHALDGGFKFLFGRLREKQAASPRNSPKAAAPKTLEEARKIVNSPVLPSEEEVSIGESALLSSPSDATAELSSDPLRYSDENSNEQVIDPHPSPQKFAATQSKATAGTNTVHSTAQPTASGYAAVESMRNLGNTLNPLKGFPGMMRSFGSRSSTPVGSVTVSSPATASPLEQHHSDEKAASFRLDSVAPPIQRFVELKDTRELNFFDVELLLRDYQRLAGAVNAARLA